MPLFKFAALPCADLSAFCGLAHDYYEIADDEEGEDEDGQTDDEAADESEDGDEQLFDDDQLVTSGTIALLSLTSHNNDAKMSESLQTCLTENSIRSLKQHEIGRGTPISLQTAPGCVDTAHGAKETRLAHSEALLPSTNDCTLENVETT